MGWCGLNLGIAASMLGIAAGSARAQTRGQFGTPRIIALSGDAMPTAGGRAADTVTSFELPAIDSAGFGFLATGSRRHGLFSIALPAIPGGPFGLVTSEVERGDAIPGAPGPGTTFDTFIGPSRSAGSGAFAARDSAGQTGIFTASSGALARIADADFTRPSATAAGTLFTRTSPAGTTHLLREFAGNTQTLASSDTLVDGSQLGPIAGPAAGADLLAFRAGALGADRIIARATHAGGALTTIAAVGSIVPDAEPHHDGGCEGERRFGGFRSPAVAGRSLAFTAADSDSEGGVYLATADAAGVFSLAALVDENSHVPGTQDHFLGFADSVSITTISNTTDPRVAMIGFGEGGQFALMLWENGRLDNVLLAGDLIDGRTIATMQIGSEALFGDSLAMQAEFTDGTSALVVIPVPGPASAGSLVLWAGFALRRRRRTVNVRKT